MLAHAFGRCLLAAAWRWHCLPEPVYLTVDAVPSTDGTVSRPIMPRVRIVRRR